MPVIGISKVFIFILLPILASCSTTTSLRHTFSFRDNSEMGVLFMSMTYVGQNGFFIDYKNIQDQQISGRLLVDDAVGVPFSFERSDFDDARGKVVAIELPPGDYELFSWGIRSGFLKMSAIEPFSMKVKLMKGSVTYAGNFHMIPTDRLGAMVSAAEVHFADKLHRDAPAFLEKHPNISPSSIYMGIPESIAIRDIGRGSESSLDFISIIVPAVIIAPVID